jgi:hypothetical protein
MKHIAIALSFLCLARGFQAEALRAIGTVAIAQTLQPKKGAAAQ